MHNLYMNYDLLLLDFDGTICDTKPSIVYSIAATFDHFRHEVPTTESIDLMIARGLPLSESFAALSGENKVHDEQEWTTRYREIYHTEGDAKSELFSGVRETLQTLARHVPLVIMSNKTVSAIQQSLDRFGLTEYITLLVGDGMTTERRLELKPSRMVFDEIIRPKYQTVPTQRILMAGDTQTDIAFGNNCGIRSCWASYGYGQPTEARLANPHYTITSFGELENIVLKQA